MGGSGYGDNSVGKIYGDDTITNLWGGSGGCMRGPHPMEINIGPSSRSFGRGGHGGGAIEIVAANDLIVGEYGKFIVNGGDGEQTSEGGGGGGSGGSVVLSAGGVIVNKGTIDASGGKGGHGGRGKRNIYTASQIAKFPKDSWQYRTLDHMAGGGGAGGRVAMFGQSVTNTPQSTVNVEGGKCGIYKSAVNTTFIELKAAVLIGTRNIALSRHRIQHIGATFINDTTLPTWRVFETDITYYPANNFFVCNYTILVRLKDIPKPETGSVDAMDNFDDYKQAIANYKLEFQQKRDISLGGTTVRMIRLEDSGQFYNHTLTDASPSNCTNHGGKGSVFIETAMTTNMYVGEGGAEGTAKALFLSNRESTRTTTGSDRESPFSWNGPTIRFRKSQPTRVTYYTKLNSVGGESQKSNFGTLFSLLQGTVVTSPIGVFVGDNIKHGANFGSAVDERFYLKRFSIIDEYPAFDRWYKIDIHIQWDKQIYYILLDDTVVTKEGGESFVGEHVNGLRISLTRAVDVWFDEIYVGFDNTMDFICPRITRQQVKTMT